MAVRHCADGYEPDPEWRYYGDDERNNTQPVPHLSVVRESAQPQPIVYHELPPQPKQEKLFRRAAPKSAAELDAARLLEAMRLTIVETRKRLERASFPTGSTVLWDAVAECQSFVEEVCGKKKQNRRSKKDQLKLY